MNNSDIKMMCSMFDEFVTYLNFVVDSIYEECINQRIFDKEHDFNIDFESTTFSDGGKIVIELLVTHSYDIHFETERIDIFYVPVDILWSDDIDSDIKSFVTNYLKEHDDELD